MVIAPQNISGFPEFLPEEQIVANRLMDIIRRNYERAGFTPIETPAVERLDILTSKGADDREIYGIHRINGSAEDADLGLHFDLTVPLARYTVEHFADLTFPFRRYQIQKAWRGERAQAGRAREFYQADIDIIGDGKLSIFADVEILGVIHGVLSDLDIGDYRMRINNRKILMGFLESLDIPSKIQSGVARIIDKRMKISADDLSRELAGILGRADVTRVLDYIAVSQTSNSEILTYLATFTHSTIVEGLSELQTVYQGALDLGVTESHLVLDPTIVRGLGYYTGTVYETFLVGHEGFGSICSGGRYENLASYFTTRTLPGVGVSIGVTRLLDYLFSSKKVTTDRKTPSELLITRHDDRYLSDYLALVREARAAGINTEIYLDGAVKFGKQIAYADRKGIPYVLVMGEDEQAKGIIQIKDMEAQEVREYPRVGWIAAWRGA